VELLHDGSPLPALIITDLLMPGTTGWDFMKHIRDDAALRSLPVIIVTGAEAGEGFALADAVIQKPLNMDALVKAIRTLWPPPGALPL
jgi:CheY-like chemotaxis protein